MTRKLRDLLWSFAAVILCVSALSACGGDGDEPDGGSSAGVTIGVSPDEISVPADGGTYTVEVTTTGGEWGAYAKDEWLSVQVTGSNTSKGKMAVTVAANSQETSRTGTVNIQSGTGRKTVTVVQAGKEPPLAVAVSELYSLSSGESFTVEVTGRSQFTATAAEDWIKVQVSGSQLTVVTDVNVHLQRRTGKVTVTAGSESASIAVTQESAEVTDITTPDGYTLVWHDEFSEGTTLNSADWKHEVQGAGWVNNELQTYVNGSADGKRVTELVDGKLRINCFKGSNGKIYSGRVYAKVTEGWTYAYIEARIKLPKGKGTWPAFWMMPVDFRSWPADGEIDIMEEVGVNPNYVSSSLHATAHVHSNNTQVTHEMYLAGAEDDFHVYAIEWTHDNITTYVDGKVQLSYDNRGLGRSDWPYDDPFYVILNLAWGGDWGGWNGVNEAALPATLMVDYVRVFQRKQ